jgi:trk system potassium uptake protein TrkH
MLPWNSMLRDLGILLQIPAFLCLPTLVVAVGFREWWLLPGFGITAVVSLGLGQYLVRRQVDEKQTHSLAASMVTVGAAWLVIGVLATIPILSWAWLPGAGEAAGAFGNFWTAFFEAMSGITSTGLSMASDASLLPRTIQWWRSLLEWIGGVGVVVLTLAIVRPAEAGRELMSAEARESRIGPSFKAMGRRIWWLFVVLTVFAILLFATLGMPWWEALNHGMTGIATGGFTVTSGSLAPYSASIQLAAALVMLLGAVSFHTWSTLIIERQRRAALRDVPTLVLLGLFAAGLVALVGIGPGTGAHRDIVAFTVQWASALGTCGFSTQDLSQWRSPLLLILLVGMFIGGAAGSTAGGLKIDRAILVFLGPIWHIRRRLSRRRGVQYYVIAGKKVREKDALRLYRSAVTLASLYLLCLLLGTFILLLDAGPDLAPYQVMFEATSALSNVGLSTGLTSASLPWLSKLILVLLMWMGRLEITAVLVLVGLPLLMTSDRARSRSRS